MLELSAERILSWVPAVLIALTFHEYAHGWTAMRLGDHTARLLGRLTLNPIRHLDPIGTLLLFLVGFGWAKPVPVNPMNFRGDVKRGMMLVALAGPGANLVLAFAGAVVLGVVAGLNPDGGDLTTLERGGLLLFLMGQYLTAGGSALGSVLLALVLVNLILAFFNLLPVPPLDGSKILAGLLPGRQRWLYSLEQYGIIILLVLVFTGVIGRLFLKVIYPAFFVLVQTVSLGIARCF